MTREVTEDEKKRYLETDGTHCMFCAGENFHDGKLRGGGGSGIVFKDLTCLGCGETWREIYHLSEVQYPAREDFAKVERP